MNRLFETVRISGMEIKNRFVRSATHDAATVDPGYVSDKQLILFSDLAAGGVGLIITGIMYVHPMGQLSPFMASICDDVYIPGLKKLTEAVHQYGAKIAIQLYHAGRDAVRVLGPKNRLALAPSVIKEDPYFEGKYREFTDDEIVGVITAFSDAARRAREAGFDAVQLHGAHGYLLSQFLSPFNNRREDQWGGSIENRSRIHLEILKDIRKKTGEDFPVLIKLGVEDAYPDGLTFADGIKVAKTLAGAGFDALEVSLGMRGNSYEQCEFKTKINKIEKEAYYRDWCRAVKQQVEVPVMMVGGIRSPALMEEIIAAGDADFISLSRPLIREPNIINAWQKGETQKSACISCNKCLEVIRSGIPLHCVLEKKKTEQT
jgi:2,4-dienoyl-CoA reductase-like NADH-dependent reductase (Old Yellow Enzyme family)